MKISDIYKGTIKRCENIYCYKKYGEEYYVGEFLIGNTEFGTIGKSTSIVTDEAILIKVNENQVIWLNNITNLKEELLVNLGFNINVINSSPSSDKELFFDKETLTPYFNSKEDKKISVKTLKKTIMLDNKAN